MSFDYDAICVVSYGGPRVPEDVLPFMRNATRGRGIPDERLLEVSKHYDLFGGASPINERNAELMEALGAALRERGIDVPIVIGNRNWTPFLPDTFTDLAASGARRVLALATAGYASYSGCRQYREDIAAALDATAVELQIDKVGAFAETEGFIAANVDALRDALARAEGRPRVVFVTHSIPLAMDAASGPGGDNTYSAQHARVAAAIAAQAGLDDDRWEIAYCSRSGAPHIPWLEPDVNDRLEELAEQGTSSVVTVPFGFINDHMEVVYDLDTQASQTAAEQGLSYVRAATAGTHPAFIAMLADKIADLRPGEVGGRRTCGASCCLSGRPGDAKPAACGTESATES